MTDSAWREVHRLKAVTSNGDVWVDPSEDLLFELFEDIRRGDEIYFIVFKESDPTDETFGQITLNADGTWLVDYREGGPDEHFTAEFSDHRQAHAVLTAWCFGHDPDLLASTTWVPLSSMNPSQRDNTT